MNSTIQETQKTGNLQVPGSGHRAADASWKTCLAVVAVLAFGRHPAAKVIADVTSLGLILLGLCLSILAFASIRRQGTKGILAPAAVGLVINGLLLAIFTTNFLAARAKHQVATQAASRPQITTTPPRLADFHRGGLAFRYDTRYRVGPYGTQGQILLQSPDSFILLTSYAESADVAEFLPRMAEQVRAGYEQTHYTDIRLGAMERLQTTTGSAGKVTLKYTRPDNSRAISDIYFISTDTNAVNLLHIYPENRRSVVSSQFQPVLTSFLR